MVTDPYELNPEELSLRYCILTNDFCPHLILEFGPKFSFICVTRVHVNSYDYRPSYTHLVYSQLFELLAVGLTSLAWERQEGTKNCCQLAR